MSTIANLFNRNLDKMRQSAKENNVHIVEVIAQEIESYTGQKPYALFTRDMECKKVEQALIDRYRVLFYERMADSCFENIQQEAKKLVKNNNAMVEKIKANLKSGRSYGTLTTKIRSIVIQSIALDINNDLLKNPSTAGRSVDERAGYIEKKLADKSIEIRGKSHPAKRSFGTIKKWITGVKSVSGQTY